MLVPEIDLAGGTVTLAIWQSVLLAGLLLFLLLLSILRGGWARIVPHVSGSIVRMGLILFAILAAWTLLERLAERDRADVRRALDQRILEMTTRAVAPGASLGCFEANLGGTTETACEQTIFAAPEAVTAASAYVVGSLSLLADGRVNGVDADTDPTLAALRRRLETDRFGFVAQALAGEGCSAERCERFALFTDASRIAANLKARTFETLVARHSAGWQQPASAAAPAASAAPPPPAPLAAAAPATGRAPGGGIGIDFPSAASIPPVSIMTDEPPLPPSQSGAGPVPVAGQKRPPASARPAARAQTAPTGPPIQIGPPAANAGTEPNPQ